MFETRFVIAFLVGCFVPSLLAAALVYLVHSETARMALNLGNINLPPIDNFAFVSLLRIQGFFAFLLTAWVGPGLISTDLANHALPLFLSRPISRAEYVAGKIAALIILLSSFTWVPGLLIFALQAGMEPKPWLHDHWGIAPAYVFSALLWITLLALLALALSAWVKWRILASLAMVSIFFIPAGLGEVFNLVTGTIWGRLLNLTYLMSVVWSDIFHDALGYRLAFSQQISLEVAVAVLIGVCAICVTLLNQRLRAREVVRD